MKTDYTNNLADCLMNKDEKISNLYSSLLEAVNFVQALENGGDIEDTRENQHITGCMTSLANTLLRQPYRVIMEQQSGLLQSMMEINRTVTALIEKVTNNGEKVGHLQEETTYNATAVLEKLQAINRATSDTQTHVSVLEGRDKNANTWTTETPTKGNPNTSHATGPLYKPKGKPDATPGVTKPNTNPLTAHHPCQVVITIPQSQTHKSCSGNVQQPR